MLEDFHRWVITTAFSASLLTVFPTSAPATLAGVEVGTTQVSGSVIVSAISLTIPASFAIRQECFVRGDINTNPNLTKHGMDPLNVSAQLVLPMEAIGLVVAHRTIRLLTWGPLYRSFGNGCDLF
jgi:hypothetical protein